MQKSFDDIIKESIRDVLKSKVNSIEQQRKEFVKDIIEKDVDDLVAGDLTLLNEDEIKIIFNKVNEKYGKEFNVQLKWMEFWESNGHYILIKIGKRSVPYIVLFNALYYQDDNKNVYHLNKLEDGIKMLREYKLLKISQVNDFYNLKEGIRDKLVSKANSIEKQKEEYVKELMGDETDISNLPYEKRNKIVQINGLNLKDWNKFIKEIKEFLGSRNINNGFYTFDTFNGKGFKFIIPLHQKLNDSNKIKYFVGERIEIAVSTNGEFIVAIYNDKNNLLTPSSVNYISSKNDFFDTIRNRLVFNSSIREGVRDRLKSNTTTIEKDAIEFYREKMLGNKYFYLPENLKNNEIINNEYKEFIGKNQELILKRIKDILFKNSNDVVDTDDFYFIVNPSNEEDMSYIIKMISLIKKFISLKYNNKELFIQGDLDNEISIDFRSKDLVYFNEIKDRLKELNPNKSEEELLESMPEYRIQIWIKLSLLNKQIQITHWNAKDSMTTSLWTNIDKVFIEIIDKIMNNPFISERELKDNSITESIKDRLKSKVNEIQKQKEEYIREIIGNKSLFDTTPEERMKLMEISPILVKPIFDEVKKQISDKNTSGEIIINHQVILLRIEKQHEQKASLMTFLSFDYPSGKYILRQNGLKSTSFENYNDMLNKLKEIL